MNRRTFLRNSAALTSSLGTLSALDASPAIANPVARRRTLIVEDVLSQHYPFTLPALGYAVDAVEPAVDALTMSIHHDKHHAAYVANLNAALASQAGLHSRTLRDLLTGLSTLPDGIRTAVRNNAGGHANHAFFWTLLAPTGEAQPTGELARAVMRDFGSLGACVAALKAAGIGQFGSGWAWLIRDGGGKLTVRSSANQDTPLTDGLRPVIGVDVWEHAYYLKYQNRRPDYLDAVLARLNWNAAAAAYAG